MSHYHERTLRRMSEVLKLAGYSPRTVSSYLGAASRFLRHADKPAKKLTRGDVRQYFLFLTDEGQAASSTINQAHFGVRSLIRDVLKKPWRQQGSFACTSGHSACRSCSLATRFGSF